MRIDIFGNFEISRGISFHTLTPCWYLMLRWSK